MILLCVCEVFLYEFDLKKLRYLVAFLKVIFVYRFSVLKSCCQSQRYISPNKTKFQNDCVQKYLARHEKVAKKTTKIVNSNVVILRYPSSEGIRSEP